MAADIVGVRTTVLAGSGTCRCGVVRTAAVRASHGRSGVLATRAVLRDVTLTTALVTCDGGFRLITIATEMAHLFAVATLRLDMRRRTLGLLVAGFAACMAQHRSLGMDNKVTDLQFSRGGGA